MNYNRYFWKFAELSGLKRSKTDNIKTEIVEKQNLLFNYH